MGSFDRVRARIKYPERTTDRYKRLDALERLLHGTLYEHLPKDFYDEKNGKNSVPITDRRPSEIYDLADMLVNDTTSLLFTQEHSPYAKCWDAAGDGANADQEGQQNSKYLPTEKCIETLRAEYDLDATMLEAAYTGSPGSVALVVRQLQDDGDNDEFGKVYVEIVKGKECWPIYAPGNPNKLIQLVREYPIRGWDLIGQGYKAAENDQDDSGIQPNAWYFMRIELDKDEEVWYHPMIEKQYVDLKKGGQDAPKWRRDDYRSWEHEFGICPAVFIRNTTYRVKFGDGEATYGKIADMIVELDYMLSQISRAFRYSGDPWLLLNKGLLGDLAPITDEIGGGGIIGDQQTTDTVDLSQHNALVLPKDGNAQFIEINGQGLAAAVEFLKVRREWAIEIAGGMKSDQEHSGGTQSGKALEILHKKLIWLIERLRICYGDRGYVQLLRILLLGVKKGIIKLKEFTDTGAVDPAAPIRLEWPRWNKPDGSELLDIISAFQLAIGGSQKAPLPLMSSELAAAFVAMAAGETDPKRAVAKFMADRDKQVQHMGEVAKAMQPPPPPKPDSPGQANSKPK